MPDEERPPDDLAVEDGERLLRRIGPQWAVPDGAGGTRVASAAFQDKTVAGVTAMSVHRQMVLEANDLTLDHLLVGFEGYGLVAFTVAEARTLGLGVTPAEVEDDGLRGRAHAHVHGKKRGAITSALAKGCEKVVWPF